MSSNPTLELPLRADTKHSDIAIRVSNLSKCYQIYDRPQDRLKQSVVPRLQRLIGQIPRTYFREFWALKGVSFEVKKGETVGIVGRNGSGKSTLLQMIAGTLAPTMGTVETNGRTAALLELGAGFNPEFTGRENIYMNAAVLGLSAKEVAEQFENITAFADIGTFIEQPLKVYSSGMMVRLAFAISVCVKPEILIVDEALSVGDFFFQQQCAERMRKLLAEGVTILFASHDISSVKALCDRALVLRDGRLVFDGDQKEGIFYYLRYGQRPEKVDATDDHAVSRVDYETEEELFSEIRPHLLWENPDLKSVMSVGGIVGLSILDEDRMPTDSCKIGEKRIFQVYYIPPRMQSVRLMIAIKNRFDHDITTFGSLQLGLQPMCLNGRELCVFEVEAIVLLQGGQYSVKGIIKGLGSPPHVGGVEIGVTPPLGPFTVHWNYERDIPPFQGMVGLPSQASIRRLFSLDDKV